MATLKQAFTGKETPDGKQRLSITSPDLRHERFVYFKVTFICFVLIFATLWAFQAVYFGTYYKQEENAYRLTVRVLDLDAQYASTVAGASPAILGPYIVQAINYNIATMPHYHLGWQIADSAELSMLKLTEDGQGLNASEYAQQIVLNQDVFGALIIQPNATRLAVEAAQSGNANYDGRGAIAFYYEEARNFYAENQYVSFLTTQLLNGAIGQASTYFAAQQLLGDTAAIATAVSSSALPQPFSYSTFNLRPFDMLGAEAPTTAGCIYLIILTFLQTPIWHDAFGKMRRRLTVGSELILTLVVPAVSWLWLSLIYSLITIAFQVGFTRKYGHVGFFLYWILNWCTMLALGFVMETAFTLLGILLFTFFLVSWVIVNVSGAFLDLSDTDHFYLYNFVMPVWNNVDATKSIIFGTKNHLGQNFAVILAWAVLAIIALVAATLFNRRQALKGKTEDASTLVMKYATK